MNATVSWNMLCAMLAADRSICFSPEFTWQDAVILKISNARLCQETEHHDGVTQHFESQQGYITALAPSKALNAKMFIHPLRWSSTKIRRISRSTLMTEAYALSNGVEHGLRTCAALVVMRTDAFNQQPTSASQK